MSEGLKRDMLLALFLLLKGQITDSGSWGRDNVLGLSIMDTICFQKCCIFSFFVDNYIVVIDFCLLPGVVYQMSGHKISIYE